MREFRTYGSVRGAVGNDRPYRDRRVYGRRVHAPVATE
jgi:hypothetical protein